MLSKSGYLLIFIFSLYFSFAYAAQSQKIVDVSQKKTSASTTKPEEPTTALSEDTIDELSPEVDPHERFNRDMFRFNEKLDKYILKPVAKTYDTLVPQPLSNGINRAFLNLDNITNIFNDLLQTNFYQATSDSWRFIVNSTVGILGLVDVASKIGLQQNTQDFGLTLAKWGYQKSTYLVLPFFGPRTVRDTLAMPVNYFTTVYPYMKNMRVRNGLYVLDVVNKRVQLLRFEDVYEQMAIDKYVFLRNAYLQRRKYLIGQTAETEAEDTSPKADSQTLQEDDDYYYLDE
ncbi:MAG: VacJ family lipoprotein [Gammaproteobacteria bacterium]|nr:VacJ family lipoprotein [Gammaproteobacteria bacterium]